MNRLLPTLTLSLALASSLGLTACGNDDDGDSGDSANDSASDGTDDGPDGGTSDPTADPTNADTTNDTAPPETGNTPAGQLGDDCTAASDCEEDYCLMFESNGMQYGFCSRQCVKAEDCPEDGWECNLAPYTACVPG